MTFIAALRCDRIDAPFVFNQPINGASFTQWVEEQLCPTLGEGDVVILDNPFSHRKSLGVGSVPYTTPSLHTSVPTISETPAMHQSNVSRL